MFKSTGVNLRLIGYARLSRVSFSPLFLKAGYLKRAIFLKPVVKSVTPLVSYEFFLRLRVCFPPIFLKLSIICEGKILKPAEKSTCWSSHPCTIESQVAPPPGGSQHNSTTKFSKAVPIQL